MPLKSKATEARQARAAKAETTTTLPDDAPDTRTYTDDQLPASDPPAAGDPGGTSVDKAQRKARTPNPEAAARKASVQRQKDILLEVKRVKNERNTAVRDLERTYEDRLKALETEYHLLIQQQTKGVFS